MKWIITFYGTMALPVEKEEKKTISGNLKVAVSQSITSISHWIIRDLSFLIYLLIVPGS